MLSRFFFAIKLTARKLVAILLQKLQGSYALPPYY